MPVQDSIVNKTSRPLKRELKVKTLKLCQRDVASLMEVSTLESNFSDTTDELDEEDEELLTFTEILDLMQVPIPEPLKGKLDMILKQKKIPVEQNVRTNGAPNSAKKKNRFLSYTPNKKLSEICDMLSLEEVFA